MPFPIFPVFPIFRLSTDNMTYVAWSETNVESTKVNILNNDW